MCRSPFTLTPLLLPACLLAALAPTAGAAEPSAAAAAPPPAPQTAALATGAGGAEAPGDELGAPGSTGGAEYGAVLRTPAPARPVATLFSVGPATILEGSSPQIRVRIDEADVRRVRARLVFYPVGGHGELLRVDLGEVVTGRVVATRRFTNLAPGRYVVRLHAKDPHGATLRRRATTSGRADLTVRGKPTPKPATTPKPAPPAPKTPAPTTGAPLPVVAPPSIAAPASTRGVFPVRATHGFGGEDARFGAGRPGHIHEGQDVTAASGVPVVAPLSGTVTTLAFQAKGAGQYVVMRAADGRSFFFAHLIAGSTSELKIGQGVSAGQQLGRLGSTGESSGPHLHFEIWVGGWRTNADSHPVDPLAQLLAWDR
jgi:murein DD-endopeptidase MepM/ murein hydrolase activator NlpD